MIIIAIYFAFFLWYNTGVFRSDKLSPGYPPHDFRDIFIKTRIHAWINDTYTGEPWIIFYHGNTGNMSYYTQLVTTLSSYYQYNFLIFDYSGYGISFGTPDPQSVRADSLEVYDYMISQNYRPDEIILMGYSFGGAMATYVATQRSVKGLILSSTFTSLDAIPGVPGVLFKFMGFDTFPTINIIKNINCRLVVWASMADQYIPYTQGETLAKDGNGLFIEIYGGHSNPQIPKEVIDETIHYINEA